MWLGVPHGMSGGYAAVTETSFVPLIACIHKIAADMAYTEDKGDWVSISK
jgi:hypothetical protein